MRHTIVWSIDASNELLDIVSFQKEKYGSRKALETYEKLREKVIVTREQPEIGRVVPELVEIGLLSVRELIESPWRILYTVNESRVEIISVIDSRRNFEEILYKKILDGKLT